MKSKIVKGLICAVFISVASGCGDSAPSTGQYWNVVIAGESLAKITFGTPLSTSQIGIVSGGTTTAYSVPHHEYNLLIAGGGSVCQMVEGGGTVLVQPGGQTGYLHLNGACLGNLTSDMQVILGGSVASILDAHNAYIVEGGRTVVGIIQAPGSVGASTGNIAY